MRRFVVRPAVVSSFAKNIHLFPPVLPDIPHPDFPCFGIDAEPPWMTKPNRIELATQGVRIHRRAIDIRHAKERIIRRDTIEGVAAAIPRNAGMRCWLDATGPFVHI